MSIKLLVMDVDGTLTDGRIYIVTTVKKRRIIIQNNEENSNAT